MTSLLTKQTNAVWRVVFILVLTLFGQMQIHAATLTSIDVTPINPTIEVGQTLAFTATGTFSDMSTRVLGGSATAVATGENHTCALVAGGQVQCWGNGNEGELGDNSTTNALTPVMVSGLSGAMVIAAGGNHTCALMASGQVQCWGENNYGQLGSNSTTRALTPVMVSGLSGATAITAGINHTCALVAGGQVQCWGYNYFGQLGDNSTTNALTPVTVSGLSGATAIAAGGSHTCALIAGGQVQCWGSNYTGQLGNNSTTDALTPVTVNGLSGAMAIAAGGGHTCALVAGGQVQCWGYKGDGELGNGEAAGYSVTPVGVSSIGGIMWDSNSSVATIDASGLATAVGTGATSITATVGSVAGNTALTVNSATVYYSLSTATVGTGSGSVSGGGTYSPDTYVSVSVTVDAGSSFSGWTGADAAECGTGVVLMDADKICTAIITLNTGPSPGTITTVAGSGTRGFSGDGGSATNAQFNGASQVAFDSAGNMYIADAANHRVRKVDSEGIITTIAGDGTDACATGGGPATATSLSYPTGVAVDGAGNLYIGDCAEVYKVDGNGILSIVAGGGVNAGASADGGPAVDAALTGTYDIASDAAGNLYIVGKYDNVVRKVNTSGIITTVAGNYLTGFSGDGGQATSASLSATNGVAVDSAGNLYIADDIRIRKVDTAGIITTVAGGGTALPGDGGSATSAQLTPEMHVAVDNAGNLYIAEKHGYRVRKVDTNGIITTVAGNGTPGYSGDGGSSTDAQLGFYVDGLGVDANGNLYIPDNDNEIVRRVVFLTVTPGIIDTVAGNGTSGFSGDGGAAVDAQLSSPSNLAVDSAGNLYIADYGNNRIRKVDANGIITTVVGNGTAGYSGDGGPASAAELSIPTAVAVDSVGNLYIADFGNGVIRKVDTNGIITTVAGGGGVTDGSTDGGSALGARISAYDVNVDAAGNLYIIGYDGNTVRKVDTAGIITTVAGNYTTGYSGDGSPATSASLSHINDIAVDTAGNLYIADTGNARIRKVDTAGIITTVAGGGSTYPGDGLAATSVALYGSTQTYVAVDSAGNLYIDEYGSARLRKVDSSGIITTVAGDGTSGTSGDGGSATSAQLSGVSYGMTVDAAGDVYISQQASIRRVTAQATPPPPSSGIIDTVAGDASLGAGYSGDGGSATAAQLGNPSGIAFDSAGDMYIADYGNNRVRKVDINGVITTVAGNGINDETGDGGPATSAAIGLPTAVAVDGAGNLYIATDTYLPGSIGGVIRKVDTNGIITTVAGGGVVSDGSTDGGSALDAQISGYDVNVDTAGNLYIMGYDLNTVRKIDTAGIITTVAGNYMTGFSGDGGPATSASLNHVEDITVDALGNLYIADTGNARIRKVDTAGIITTVAGGGSAYPGDGQPATSVLLTGTTETYIAVDSSGNLYIDEFGTALLRKVNSSGIVSTVAGTGTSGYSGDGGAATSAQIDGGTYGIGIDAADNVYLSQDSYAVIRRIYFASTVSYTLSTATAGTGSGTVSGGGTYSAGTSVSVSAIADAGSIFSGWTGPDAAECGTGTVAMDSDKSCTATFTLNTYTVTPSAGANGSITPSVPQTVGYGNTAMFTVTPDTGYGVSVGGSCGGTLVGNTYTTAAITGDCTVDVSFSSGTSGTISTVTAGANGTISPSGPQTVSYGDMVTYTLTPDPGYDVTVGGTCFGTLVDNGGTYTYSTNAITGDCTVNVTFNLITPPTAALIGGSAGGAISSTNTQIDSGVFGQVVAGSTSSTNYAIDTGAAPGI